MKNRLLLVDGSNLLFQMFYGIPARIINSDGKAIHGTLGFVGALLKIIRMTEPTHMAVLFDGERGSTRNEIYSDYKANRHDLSEAPEQDSPFSQLPDICTALDHLRIAHCESNCCETDDLIAAYALTYKSSTDIVISSFDSDFFQLICDNVSVLRYRGDKTVICNPQYIRERLGIEPEQYADFKSLIGDSADNIKGADKIGPKTAAQLLSQFGTLEAIIKNADNIKKPIVRESVVSNAERLRLNYRLIKLDTSAPMSFELSELKYQYGQETTTEVLRAIGLR